MNRNKWDEPMSEAEFRRLFLLAIIGSIVVMGLLIGAALWLSEEHGDSLPAWLQSANTEQDDDTAAPELAFKSDLGAILGLILGGILGYIMASSSPAAESSEFKDAFIVISVLILIALFVSVGGMLGVAFILSYALLMGAGLLGKWGFTRVVYGPPGGRHDYFRQDDQSFARLCMNLGYPVALIGLFLTVSIIAGQWDSLDVEYRFVVGAGVDWLGLYNLTFILRTLLRAERQHYELPRITGFITTYNTILLIAGIFLTWNASFEQELLFPHF